jgi:osmoprotectant transport system permease protein
MPALAMLALLIPPLGIGTPAAVVALVLYSVLPMVRNTHAGLSGVSVDVEESARAIGLGYWRRLWSVDLPLAMPTVLAGVKTAAVINIGTATLAALIGAGGYGQPILTGIRLKDNLLILEGAVPAALMAVCAQGLFGLAERCVVSRGLRLRGG